MYAATARTSSGVSLRFPMFLVSMFPGNSGGGQQPTPPNAAEPYVAGPASISSRVHREHVTGVVEVYHLDETDQHAVVHVGPVLAERHVASGGRAEHAQVALLLRGPAEARVERVGIVMVDRVVRVLRAWMASLETNPTRVNARGDVCGVDPAIRGPARTRRRPGRRVWS
jgi:hypothetical protein